MPTKSFSARRALVLLLALWLLAIACAVGAQDAIKAKYSKYEVMIPMRDGVRLFTVVYVPKETSQTYPILLQRTPYSVAPYGSDKFKGNLGPSPKFAEEGYIFAYQDVRGCLMSEGQFINMRPENASKIGPNAVDESTDTYDTIDWLIHCIPNNNGNVGMWGISYPGFYTACGLVNSHPALKAASPQAPIADWFIGDDAHHNGAFYLLDTFDFFSFFGPVRPKPQPNFTPGVDAGKKDAYQYFLDAGSLANLDTNTLKGKIPFWSEMMQHPNYDAFWKSRNLLPNLKGNHAAVMTTGGWYDAEDLYGPLHVFSAVERQNPGADNRIVMGPWFHGGWAGGDMDHFGDDKFGMKTALFYREQLELPFFDYYLKGKGSPPGAKATVFATGSNQWLQFAAWPPADAKIQTLNLGKNKTAAFTPPTGTNTAATDTYVSDPANPVPYLGETLARRKSEYMDADQRFASARPDVLTYQTAPLAEDMTFAGPIVADLWVSTTGTDSDWVVKVIDVFPDDAPDPDPNPRNIKMAGYQMLIRGDIMRGRFRNSYEKPAPFTPGKPTEVKWELRDICHTFKKGHRVMVQVQSSWFPLVDRNPQVFVPNIYLAKNTDFQKATQTVYLSGKYESRILMPQITVNSSSVLSVGKEYAAAPPPMPMEDKEPQVTAMLAGILKGLGAGKIDRSLLTPEVNTAFSDDMLHAQSPFLKQLGDVKTLELMARNEAGSSRHYTYRARYAESILTWSLSLNKDNKVEELTVAGRE